MESESIDILILTPLSQELAALREELGRVDDENADTEFSYVIWRSVYNKDKSGFKTIVAIMPLEKDQLSAMNATHLALSRWSPRCFILMGIAGQLSAKVNLGDVVVGRHILLWDIKRKEKQDADGDPTADYAITPVPSAKWGANIANLLKSDTKRYREWRERCFNEKPRELTGALPELHVEDVASGSATIDSESMRQMLSGLSRYLYAVETEAAGALTAFHSRNSNALSIVIRGISDPSAGKGESDAIGDGAWRQYAARNAAKLLIFLLGNYSIPIGPEEGKVAPQKGNDRSEKSNVGEMQDQKQSPTIITNSQVHIIQRSPNVRTGNMNMNIKRDEPRRTKLEDTQDSATNEYEAVFGKDVLQKQDIFIATTSLPCHDKGYAFKAGDENIMIAAESVTSDCEKRASNYLTASIARETRIYPQNVTDVSLKERLNISFIAIGGNNRKKEDIHSYGRNLLVKIGYNQYLSGKSGRPIIIHRKSSEFDYGIILKTHPRQFPEKVWILCAGLSEWGTSGAAYFLSTNWKRIYDYAKDGPFAVIIEVEKGKDESVIDIAMMKCENDVEKLVVNDIEEENHIGKIITGIGDDASTSSDPRYRNIYYSSQEDNQSGYSGCNLFD